MIAINKSEKEMIIERFPDICLARTMKQDSKRHHYYMEERKDAMAYLMSLRGVKTPGGGKKRGYKSEHRKETR